MELRLGDILQGDELAHLTTLPAHAARLAPLPDDVHAERPRGARAGGDNGALRAPGRGLGRRAARREPDRHDRHRLRQDPRVQPARARRACARAEEPRALPLPDEGARTGSGARTRRARPYRASALRSTTATRRPSGAGRSASGRTSCSRTPTCCTSACCRATTCGPTSCTTCATSSSTRRTSTAASSARTSATCFAGCGAWPACTDRSRSSCSPRRRSRTRASSRTRSSARTRRRSATTPRRAQSGRSRSGTRSCSTPSSGSARARSATRRGSWPSSCSATCGRSASPRAASRRS